MRHILIGILSLLFAMNVMAQVDSLLTISVGTKATFIIVTEDSIHYLFKEVKMEPFSKTVNSNDKKSELILKDSITNCIEIVFCNGTYGDAINRTFLFIKNAYPFPLDYNASILPSSKNRFENSDVETLYPKALSREDWPYKIEQIKIFNFKKKVIYDAHSNTRETSSVVKFIGLQRADSEFVTDLNIINVEMGHLTLNKIDSIEKKLESKDISPDYKIDLDESLYPNKKHFQIETPKIFERTEDSAFTIKIWYYYTKIDSSIKVIEFEWDKNLPFTKDDEFGISQCDINRFQNKLLNLENIITQKIGKPIRRRIKPLNRKRPFRDDMVWKSQNGLKVDLYMFGNENYRQIMLDIYKE